MFQYFNIAWQELQHPNPNQIRALDGLRSFAILLVIATHTAQDYTYAGGTDTWILHMPFVQGGWAGVDLFFVLSGFFIGKQLWAEIKTSGTIHIGSFILRRGMRIWPLYFFILMVAVFISTLSNTTYQYWWPDFIFLSNYYGETFVHGGWSLSTEEQFYLTIPLLLWSLSRINPSLLHLRKWIIGFIILAPIIRAITWSSLVGLQAHNIQLEIKHLYWPFHTHFDGLAVGLFISNLFSDFSIKPPVPQSRVLGTIIITIILAVFLRLIHREVFNYTGLALVFGSAVYYCLYSKNQGPAFLKNPTFYIISRLSFGMYLIYRYFLPLLSKAVIQSPMLSTVSPSLIYVLLFLITCLIASMGSFITFALIELPFLRLRNRWLKSLA